MIEEIIKHISDEQTRKYYFSLFSPTVSVKKQPAQIELLRKYIKHLPSGRYQIAKAIPGYKRLVASGKTEEACLAAAKRFIIKHKIPL